MPGYLPRTELLALYQRCAVAAVPSRYEGFGYAAAQALCAGVPCVVSERTSLPEVVGSDARVAAADDPKAWATALAAAMCGDDARAQRVRPAAIARFSWDASAAQIERIYASVNR
jgi:glycosyltransferase involved in cell wall biosynthesis